MMRSFLHSLIRFLFTVLARVCADGLENIPGQGPGILAANHLSRLDSPLIFSLVDRTDLTALVADEYQKVFFTHWLVNAVNGIWINREQADLRALRVACSFLEQGGLLGIAPEGTRSKTGALMQAKTGRGLPGRAQPGSGDPGGDLGQRDGYQPISTLTPTRVAHPFWRAVFAAHARAWQAQRRFAAKYRRNYAQDCGDAPAGLSRSLCGSPTLKSVENRSKSLSAQHK